jgi:hypothetical protein
MLVINSNDPRGWINLILHLYLQVLWESREFGVKLRTGSHFLGFSSAKAVLQMKENSKKMVHIVLYSTWNVLELFMVEIHRGSVVEKPSLQFF